MVGACFSLCLWVSLARDWTDFDDAAVVAWAAYPIVYS